MAEEPLAQMPVPPRLLPWHEPAAAQLRGAWAANRLSHALLLQGADGLGKRELAAWLTAAVLCDASNDGSLQHCGQCASCALIAAGSHPDLLWVAPEADKQQIAVDQTRAATERLTKTSYRQGYKVVIVEPAHQMTGSAANSLLKTLEEPTPRSLLILLTSRPSALLPTVRSRCQKVSMRRPSRGQALAWLQEQAGIGIEPQLLEFTGDAPLRALEFANGGFSALDEQMQRSLAQLLAGQADITQVASEWAKDALVDRLTWVDLWLMSAARAAVGGSDDLFTFPARSAHLPSLPAALNISKLYALIDQARQLKAQLARTALQRELAVESWLIGLLRTVHPVAASRAG